MKSCCVLFACVLTLLLFACDADEKKRERPPAPVTVVKALRQNVPLLLNAVGKVQASAEVNVRARVTGEIVEVYFTEGDTVSAGQPLLLIDPKPYEADLHAAEAELVRCEANLEKALRDKARYEKLAGSGYVSREAYEQVLTAARTHSASVRVARASVEKASLNVGYCSVTAPVDGRAGELALHKGNIVKTTETAILRLDTLNPSYVHFSIPERHLSAVQNYFKEGNPLFVTAAPRGAKPVEGIVNLLDNSVDTATGTIHLRASFENADQQLWPGQFVEVSLQLGTEKNALCIPSHAVMEGQGKKYVYIVENGKAKYREVEIAFSRAGISLVANGLSEGDSVVTEGQMRLAPDVPVSVKASE